MTLTVKLDPLLEEQIRQHAARAGSTTSDVVRAALQAYLQQPVEACEPSAYELGATLFGRHAGPADLASRRKAEWDAVTATRQAQRQRTRPGPAA